MILKQGAFHWHGASTTSSLLGVARDCLITNSATLYLYADATNSPGPAYGALVSVASNITVSTNSWILPHSNSTNGGSVCIEAGSITIEATGGIDADAKGYGSRTWDGTVKWGYGPGAGYSSGGAGHGGAGAAVSGTPGGTYGSSNAPAQPGSGGGTYGTYAGGMGGGLVWLNVREKLILDGDIRARGNVTYLSPYVIDVGGGGSGGGIHIRCKRLAGAATGRILADGGVSYYTRAATGGGGSGGSGGGGRIAVWRMYDEYEGARGSVEPGTAYDAQRTAQPGTIFWGWIPIPGTIIISR